MEKTGWIVSIGRLLFLALLTLHLSADSNTTDENATFIDEYHDSFSDQVVKWSDKIDQTLVNLLGEEVNATKRSDETPLEKERESSDRFFQTQKYLNETSQTYIRLRVDTSVRSLESDETNFHVRVHLPLSRTKKRLRLFIEDLNEDNAENLVKKSSDDPEKEEVSPKIGINYFAPRAFGIHSKYSLGLSGLHPYVRARYSMVFEPGNWVVEPVQTFQYSEKYDLSERTNLYLDTEPWENTLFRIQLSRGTRAHRKGMYYGLGFTYNWGMTRHSGMRIVQTFAGNTKYEYTPEESTKTETFPGIYNYTTAFGYRRSVWRKWLYVEMIPAVNFHRQYDYRPNYSFRIFFDLFFGNYH
ncbi:hypothetical protein [Hydrogenimonas sp.]|uniref:hypothetical protein n=1 Tax=Hydrogenimonas sp. TaxID=2231112 RepID=UPI00261922E7|nr:hypothetical protein [Hydrogenimonas sp.]